MASLNLITSNPVTDSYNASQKRIADQDAADLQNAINEQAYSQNEQLFPGKLHAINTTNDYNDLKLSTERQTQPDTILKSRNEALGSGVTLQQGQENLRHAQASNPNLERSGAAQATTNESQARVDLATEGAQVADANNKAVGSGLQNTLTQQNINQGNEKDARSKIVENPELHENLTILARTDPEEAIRQGRAAGVITTPEQEALLRNPDLVGQSNVIISVLRSVAPADAKWRDAMFDQVIQEAQQNPAILSFANRAALRQRLSKEYEGGGGGPFEGNGMDQQVQNILLQGDPGAPEYLAAYNIAAAPVSKYDAATGMVTTQTPDMSAYRKPGTQGVASQTSAPGQAQTPAPPPAAGATPTPKLVSQAPGLTITQATPPKAGAKASTEDALKASQLLTEVMPDVQIAIDKFDALSNLKDQVASMGPAELTNWAKSPEYQRAENAVAHLVANNLYLLSGATITDVEARRRASLLLPIPGDAPQTLADKKARIMQLIDGMKQRAGSAYQEDSSFGGIGGVPTFSDPNDRALKSLPSGSKFYSDDGHGNKKLRYVP